MLKSLNRLLCNVFPTPVGVNRRFPVAGNDR